MSRSIATILSSMLDILHHDEQWIQGAEGAYDRTGQHSSQYTSCDPMATTAESWCLLGAMKVAMGKQERHSLKAHEEQRLADCQACQSEALFLSTSSFLDGYVRDEYSVSSFVEFNDRRTTSYEDVRLLIKRAMAEAEERSSEQTEEAVEGEKATDPHPPDAEVESA